MATTRNQQSNVLGSERTPPKESLQSAMDSSAKAQNIRKSTEKSDGKRTQTAEILTISSTKNYAASTAGKEKASATPPKTSPFNEKEMGQTSNPQSLKKSLTPNYNSTSKLSAQSKQSKLQFSNSKGNDVSAPSFQQTLLQAAKSATKSIDKDMAETTQFRSAEKVNPKHKEGKLSSRSDNIIYNSNRESQSDVKPIAEESRDIDYSREEMEYNFNFKENLSNLLNEKDNRIHSNTKKTSAKKSNQKDFDVQNDQVENFLFEENQDDILGSVFEEKLPSGLEGISEIKPEGQNEGKEREAGPNPQRENNLNTEETKGEVARKEYSVFEDWRILESIDKLINEEGLKTLSSRTLWAKLVDPLTGRRLLDEKRSSESMRDRYKRYLSLLDDEGKKTIKEFCNSHSLDDLKQSHCIFKKVDGLRQLVGISSQLSYDPEKMQRKTPYGAKSKKKDTKKGAGKKDTKKGKLEDSFEENEKSDREGDDKLDDFLAQQGLLEQEYNFNEEELQEDLNVKDTEDVEKKQEPEPGKIKSNIITVDPTKVKLPKIKNSFGAPLRDKKEEEEKQYLNQFEERGQNSRSNQIVEDIMIDENKKSKKRGPTDYGANFAGLKEMKKVRLNDDQDEICLQPSEIFQNRKPQKESFTIDESILIYVDQSRGFRQFVRHEPEEQEDEETIKLKQIAEKYRLDFNHIVTLFKKVSCDFTDLEDYLERKDSRLLWNEEEDADLLEDNKTAVKYLRAMKGDERVNRRREYLFNQ